MDILVSALMSTDDMPMDSKEVGSALVGCDTFEGEGLAARGLKAMREGPNRLSASSSSGGGGRMAGLCVDSSSSSPSDECP